jgi:hypothetical protein
MALKRNGVQIILVSLAPDDVDGLVHAHFWVLLAVLHLITGQNPIVADLFKVE